MKTYALVGMQPDLIPTPAERTEGFSLRWRCTTTGVEDAQRVVRVASKYDVVKRFTLPGGRLQDRIPFA